jgi:hypothetical protein
MEKETKELMFKAFKEGQATPDATDSIIKIWTSQELYSIMHKNEEFNREKAMEKKARIAYRLHTKLDEKDSKRVVK